MKEHNFTESFEAGSKVETLLDNYFSKHWIIKEASMHEQFKGIDRFFKTYDAEIAVEYKGDSVTQTSGNIFVETMSNIETGRFGWAFKSESDYIAYYLVGMDKLLWIDTKKMKSNLKSWLNFYRKVEVKNHDPQTGRTYHSRGILVPLENFIEDTECDVIELKEN